MRHRPLVILSVVIAAVALSSFSLMALQSPGDCRGWIPHDCADVPDCGIYQTSPLKCRKRKPERYVTCSLSASTVTGQECIANLVVCTWLTYDPDASGNCLCTGPAVEAPGAAFNAGIKQYNGECP